MADQDSPKQSWFDKNPKKTLISFTLILLVALTFGAEKILAHLNHSHKLVLFTERRYINLRELPPNLDILDVPSAKDLRDSDGLVRKGYRIHTDANAFILPYHHYAKPDVTLVFLGGSTTACIYVEEENRFPVVVGNLLEKATGKRITAINAGVPGNNSLHSINILMNKVIPIHPDIVVMMHNINDLASLIYDQTYWSQNPSRATIVDFTFYKNLKGLKALSTMARDMYIPNLHVAFRLLCKRIFGKTPREPEDEFARERGKKRVVDQARLLEAFQLNLQTFINICRARHLTPVLMTMFNRFKPHPDPKVLKALKGFERDSGVPVRQYLDIFQKFNQKVLEVGRANGVLVIDLARLVPPESQYIYDLVHVNDAGSKLAARIISEKLLPLVAVR